MIKPRKAPYASAEADPYRTQAEISKLLQSYGCTAVQWTSDFAKETVNLRFRVEIEYQGVKREIGIEIIPPRFEARRKTYNPLKGRHETINAPNWAQSFRLLYWYIKTKLEAIAYGLVSAEEEFFAQVMTKLPTGEQTTVFKMVVNDALALPEGRTEERHIIDVQPEGER